MAALTWWQGAALRERLEALRRSRLARDTGWMLAGQGCGVGLQAGYFLLLGRLLGPAEYGLYAGAVALVSVASSYSSLGAGTLFLRHVSTNRQVFGAYWGNILLSTALASSLLILVLALLGPRLLTHAGAQLIFAVALANCFCTQLTGCASQVFQAFEKLRYTALLNLLMSLLRFAVAAAMLQRLHHCTAGQWALAALLVSLCGALLAVGAVTAGYGRPCFAPRLLRQSASEGLGYAFATSTAALYNDVDKTLLSHDGMSVANGVYSMAYRVVDIATVPVFAMRDAAMPRLFRSGARSLPEAATLALRLLSRALPLCCLLGPAMWVAAPIIPRLLGPGFAQSVSALRWLCLIPALRSVHQLSGSALTAAGRQRWRTGAQVLAAVCNLLLNLWLIPAHGWLGAAWASLLTDGGLACANWCLLAWLGRLSTAAPVPEPSSAA